MVLSQKLKTAIAKKNNNFNAFPLETIVNNNPLNQNRIHYVEKDILDFRNSENRCYSPMTELNLKPSLMKSHSINFKVRN